MIRTAPEDDQSSDVIRIGGEDGPGWEVRRAWAVRRVDGDPGEPFLLALDGAELADLLADAWPEVRSAIAARSGDGLRRMRPEAPIPPPLPTEPAA